MITRRLCDTVPCPENSQRHSRNMDWQSALSAFLSSAIMRRSRSAYLGDSYDQSLRRLVVANTHIGTRNSIAVRAGPLAALRACRLARLGGGRARRRAPAADHRCAVAGFCRSGPRAHQAPIIQAPPNAPTCPVQARGAKTCKQRYTSTSPSMVGIAVSRRTSPPTPRSSDESARHAAMTPVQLLR